MADLDDRMRHLVAAGAEDEVIESFVLERRTGDNAHADPLLRTTPPPANLQPAAQPLPQELATALAKLRVATLRPVVNRLGTAALYAYFEIILSITDQVVRSEEDQSLWSNHLFIERLACALMDVALEHMKSESPNATPRGPSH